VPVGHLGGNVIDVRIVSRNGFEAGDIEMMGTVLMRVNSRSTVNTLILEKCPESSPEEARRSKNQMLFHYLVTFPGESDVLSGLAPESDPISKKLYRTSGFADKRKVRLNTRPLP
jgi:hypothetical protein